MARSSVRDPLDRYRWTVDIPGFSKLGFTTCSAPKYVITPREYAEGGAHLNPKIIIDKVAYTPVTLSRGVTNDTSFNKWATTAFDVVQNKAALYRSDSILSIDTALNTFQDNGAESVPSYTGAPPSYRKRVKLEHVNRNGQVEVIYVLYNAMVLSYYPASDFDATADDSVSIETLVLGYEGFDVKYTGISGFTGNILTGINRF